MNQRPIRLPLLILPLLLIITLNSLAQPIPQSQWQEIEDSIGKKTALSDLQTRLSRIQHTAQMANDIPDLARSIRDQLLIADLRTADTLYVKNFQPIDKLLAAPHTAPLLKSILFLLKARRIKAYSNNFFYRGNKNLIPSYDEKRAAALEPAEPESRYVYGDNVEYYRSFRDIGVQFFAEKIPSGISTISYESVVDREGSYLSGPASLQCMYQPSVTAYSNTITLKIVLAHP